jgi:ketosteroid isomerase-like protein
MLRLKMPFFFFSLLCLTFVSTAQSKTEKEITDLLHSQDQSWNNGDLEGFMQTYWNSDSLLFIGKSGVTYGWNNTLRNYKKGYPDTAAMGKLQFTLIRIQKISPKNYFVVGKWHLTRTAGNLQGHFSLILRKIKGAWKIVADHSS